MAETQHDGGPLLPTASFGRPTNEQISGGSPATFRNTSNFANQHGTPVNFSGQGSYYPHQQHLNQISMNNYRETSPRPDTYASVPPEQNSNFAQNFTHQQHQQQQHDTENFTNNSYGNQVSLTDNRVPNPHQQPFEAWLPPHSESAAAQTLQRKSLDETYNRHLEQGRASPGPTISTFQRQHRRGRSDEVMRCYEAPHRVPTRFGSPPPIRSNHPMHLSNSTTSLDMHSHNPGMHYGNRGSGVPSLPHSVSIDTSSMYSTYLNETLYKQNTVYINLTTSINLSQRMLKELENDVKMRERELNKLLSVQKNPTEKEYRHLKEEISILHGEITHMYDECDKLGISTDPQNNSGPLLPPQPSLPYLNTPSPTKPPSAEGREELHSPMFPHYPPRPLDERPPITKQPPPSYASIQDPVPPYDRYDIPPRTPSIPPTPVPGIPPYKPMRPPRPPEPFTANATGGSESDNERWECPSCTFNNLLVGECEVCYTPRPTAANMTLRHS